MLLKPSYAQTENTDKLCLDIHIIGTLRETHTHIIYTQ